ncbi:unnamed protein product [Caretta caretta]
MGLVLQELELWLVLSVYAADVRLMVQDPGDLAQVEACQAIYSAAFSTWVNWVKSSGLVVRDGWQTHFVAYKGELVQPIMAKVEPMGQMQSIESYKVRGSNFMTDAPSVTIYYPVPEARKGEM